MLDLLSAITLNFVHSRILSFAKEVRVSSLSNDKILDCYKLKAFADGKINVTKKTEFILGMVENIIGNRKCWLPAFSPFPRLFSKVGDCIVKSQLFTTQSRLLTTLRK